MSQPLDPRRVARLIDHTLLHPAASRQQVQRFSQEAVSLGFATVCIAPCWVSLAAKLLEKCEVRVCTVAGFPLGFEPVQLKVKAVQLTLAAGADEIDYVVNLGAVKEGNRHLVAAEMEAMRRAAGSAVLKVIIETGYLNREEMKWLCQLAVNAELDFIKTSTGFGPSGAKVTDVKFLAECGRGLIKVKAAGGIRHLKDLHEMVLAGAKRIGTSAGKQIIAQAAASLDT